MTPEERDALHARISDQIAEAVRPYLRRPMTHHNLRTLERIVIVKLRAAAAELGVKPPPVAVYSEAGEDGHAMIETPLHKQGVAFATYLGRLRGVDLYHDDFFGFLVMTEHGMRSCTEYERGEMLRRITEIKPGNRYE